MDLRKEALLVTNLAPNPFMAFYDSTATYDAGLRYDAPVPNLPKKMAKPKLELKKRTLSGLSDFVASIVSALTGNPNFATPTPPLASVSAKLAEYDTALAESIATSNAARLATSTLEQRRSELEALVTHLAGYVEAASGGDELKILTAGMQVKSLGAPVGPLPAPGNLNATAGDNEGTVDLGWEPVEGAVSYQVECKLHTDAGVWEAVKTVTSSKMTVPSLTPGTLYAFRVRAVGAAGQGPWSDEAVRRAP